MARDARRVRGGSDRSFTWGEGKKSLPALVGCSGAERVRRSSGDIVRARTADFHIVRGRLPRSRYASIFFFEREGALRGSEKMGFQLIRISGSVSGDGEIWGVLWGFGDWG